MADSGRPPPILRLMWPSTAAELAREGLHSERGPESLDLLIRMMGAHDLVHRRQAIFPAGFSLSVAPRRVDCPFDRLPK